MTLQKFLQKISSVLDKLKIDYVVTGGVAVTVWAKPRHTADVDIVVEINSSECVNNLIKLLKNEFPESYSDNIAAQNAFMKKGEFNLIEPEYGLKADFFFIKNTVYGKIQIKRGVIKKIGQKLVKFISVEDLIISKLLWYRESESSKHLEDIISVLDSQKKLDKKYLNEWINKFDLKAEWEKINNLNQ